MANTDNPNGFTPIKTISGSPVSGLIRSVTPGADDVFIGDPISITAGAGVQMAVEGICAGVVVGLAGVDQEGNTVALAPDDAMKVFFDTSADVEANYKLLYVPADGVIFEAQFDDSEDIVIGEGYDLTVGDGSTTTGRSIFEIDGNAKTNDGDVVVVEAPSGPNYDQTSGEANKRVWVSFVNTMAGQI